MNMPRLLIVTTVADTLKAFLFPYADHFRALGWKVDALANGADTSDDCALHFDRTYGIDWSRSPAGNKRVLGILRRVREIAGRENYDIVHVHTPIAAFLTRLAFASRRLAKRPCIIYTVHGFHFQPGNSPIENLAFRAAERMAARWTDYLVTINEADRLAALRLGLVTPERLRPMPGIGIDLAWFCRRAVPAAAIDDVRRRFNIRDGSAVFVMIAEFLPRKRHEDAVAAFAKMRNTDAHLVFVGTGGTIEAIRALAANSGAGERIHFADSQADVRPFVLAARAVVLPSSQEGLPRSVMESLACGVPVIGSDIRGMRDLLAGGGGTLYRCGDVEALAAQLDWYAANPVAAEELGGRALGKMSQYDTRNIITLHEELYEAAMRHERSEKSERLMAHC